MPCQFSWRETHSWWGALLTPSIRSQALVTAPAQQQDLVSDRAEHDAKHCRPGWLAAGCPTASCWATAMQPQCVAARAARTPTWSFRWSRGRWAPATLPRTRLCSCGAECCGCRARSGKPRWRTAGRLTVCCKFWRCRSVSLVCVRVSLPRIRKIASLVVVCVLFTACVLRLTAYSPLRPFVAVAASV